MLTKPSVAKYKATFNSTRQSAQLATSGGLEVIAVVATGGSGGTVVRVYDSANGAGEPSPSIDSFIIAANGGESTCFTPSQAILMTKGLYVEIEQPSGNAEAFILYR